jgi:hypothetical protein
MSTLDLGLVYNNHFEKVVGTFAKQANVNRVIMGIKIPDNWIKVEHDEFGRKYVITVCQYFDKVSSLKVKGGEGGVSVTRNDETFQVHTPASYPSFLHGIDLSMVDKNHSWKVIVRTGIGQAEFIENAFIFGYFNRNQPMVTPAQPITSAATSTPDEIRKKIFQSILDDLNQKFSNYTSFNDLTHREEIKIIQTSPTTQELVAFLKENGYNCVSLLDTLEVYL